MWNRILETSRTDCDPFGIEYQFSLYDQPPSVDSLSQAAVNAPEWLVPLGQELIDLAQDCGFEVVLCENFHQFIDNRLNTSPQLR
jgi:hypothetical protein